VGAARIGLELALRQLEYLQGVEAAPVFPVEAVRPSVRRRHDMAPRPGGVAIRLTDRFHAGAVQRQHEARLFLTIVPLGGHHRVVLEATVDVAAEGTFVRLLRTKDTQT